MTVQQAIDMLMGVSDKEMVLVMPSELGFVAACMVESGISESHIGQPIFVMMPCFCNLPESDLTVDVKAHDFEIIEN